MRLFHVHRWTVDYTDDDICRCGKIRLWPSGEIVTPQEMRSRFDRWVKG